MLCPGLQNKKLKKCLTLGMVSKTTWRPDCIQKDEVDLKSTKFVYRQVYNSSFLRQTLRNECQASRGMWSEWYSTSNSYKPVVPGISFADVIKANLGQKGHGQARPLVGIQVASKSGESLELLKEDT